MDDPARPSNDSGSTIPRQASFSSPTPKEFQKMDKETRDHWIERHLQEHIQMMKNFDVNKIQRDPYTTADSSISWKDVSFSVDIPDPDDPKGKSKIKKTILQKNSGHIPSGSLVAFMGPSGCGKTTLLDILARKKTSKYEGEVFVNGRPTDNMYQRIMTYVGQADIMPQHWTVREAIEFNSLLSRPRVKEVTTKQVEAWMDQLLSDVGLLHVKGTKIGGETVRGISGGQRRRVSLARGLVRGAQIMFCDEPTSGLSATDAELCVRVMKACALKWGITILVVIHQPRIEVANLFDKLVLLTAKPGRIVYNGPMDAAAAYFSNLGFPVPEHANPTDHFLDIITPGAPGADPDKIFARFETDELPKVIASMQASLASPGLTVLESLQKEHDLMKQFGTVPRLKSGKFAVGFSIQLRVVFMRKFKLMLRDPIILGMGVFMQIFMGCFLGLCFQGVGQKEPKGVTQMAFLFNVLMQVSMGSMQVMPQLIESRTIMKIETDEGLYSEWAYIISVGVLDTLLSIVGNTFFIVIMFALAQMPFDVLPNFYAWALLLYASMDALCCAVAAAAKNAQMAQGMATPFVMIFVMFSGFLINKISSPAFLKWMLYISPVAWVNEILAYSIYGDDELAWTYLQTFYGFEEPSITIGIIVCVGVTIFFRFFQVVFLKTLNKIEK